MQKMSLRIGVVSLGLLVALLGRPGRARADHINLRVSCPFGDGGDLLDRGFYVTNYQGTNLGRVTLRFTSDTPGLHTISLTARNGAFDGPQLGASTATVDLSGVVGSFTPASFTFLAPAVAPGSTIAFSLSLVAGPGVTRVFFDVGKCGLGDESCSTCTNVVETRDTDPPLSQLRRKSVGLRVYEFLPCNCYFSSNCPDAGDYCNWGDSIGQADSCTFREPKPSGVGDGCESTPPGYGVCDGICTPTWIGSIIHLIHISILLEVIRLWGEAILVPASGEGGLIDQDRVRRAQSLLEDRVDPRVASQIIGRGLAGSVFTTIAGDFFLHPERIHGFEEHSVPSFRRSPCFLEAFRLGLEALEAELREPGAGARLAAMIPEVCPEVRRASPGCPGLDLETCLERRITAFGLLLRTKPRDVADAGGQIPGDCNQDKRLDISDGICLVGHLFLGDPETLPCEGGTIDDVGNRSSYDGNGDNKVDLSDAISLFGYLFLGTRPHVLGAECTAIEGCPALCT